MESTFVMSVVGPANPGVIKAIAERTRALGGEWPSTKVMKLDGQLTAMMKVVVDQAQEDQLKSEIEGQFPELKFFYSPAISEPVGPTHSVGFIIDCADRPGLTKELDSLMHNLGYAVEHMDCNRIFVSSIGASVFTAKVTLAVPENVDCESLVEEIEAFSDDLRVSLA